ncbi:MAG: hypothetical protein R3C26_12420 [Calditrichia bacterium]
MKLAPKTGVTEKIVVPSVQAIPVISGFEMSENAAFLVNFMTAWVSPFFLAKLQPGVKKC